MELKPLTHGKRGNRYCGPAVISMIAGVTTEDAAALIRKHTNVRAVRGTSTGQVRRVLSHLGYTMRLATTHLPRKLTLAGWLRETVDIRTSGRVFLLVAGNHWQLITGRRYACGITGGIVSIKHEKVKRRARVTEVFEIIPLDDHKAQTKKSIEALRALQQTHKLESQQTSNARNKVYRLSSKLGIDIEVDTFDDGSQLIHLFPPEWVSELRGEEVVDYDAVAYDWAEAQQCVKAISDIMEVHQ